MCDDFPDSASLDPLEDAFVFQEIVEGATDPALGFHGRQAASALARCPRSRFSISASKNASSKLCAAFNRGSQWV
jgi:hypothetical protein